MSHAFHTCVCVCTCMCGKIIYIFIFINLMDRICAYVNLFWLFCSLGLQLNRLYVICLILKSKLKKLCHRYNCDITLELHLYTCKYSCMFNDSRNVNRNVQCFQLCKTSTVFLFFKIVMN